MKLFEELKRRNVFRVGVAYLAAAWLLAQVVALVVPAFDLPSWIVRTTIGVLAAGFPIALVVAWVFELTPEGVKRTSDVDAERSIARATGRQLDRIMIGALTLAVAVLLVDRYVLDQSTAAPRESAATASGPPTLAVLPFVNLSSDREQEYFVDGITEEILNSLARVSGLQVTGRTSSFYFKGRNEDLRTIGQTLGAENILEGSVRKGGNEVRITAQLINAATGYHRWSKTYDRTLDDIFTVQEEIAMAVADSLEVALGVGALGRIPGMTRNVEAYDAWLAGRASARAVTLDTQRAAAAHFERALALDPSFAIAWLEVANTYLLQSLLLGPNAREVEELARMADDARERARTLAPESLLVLGVEAEQRQGRGEWGEAAAVLATLTERATQSGAVALTLYPTGNFLMRVGRPREAIGYFERARAADPLVPGIAGALGWAYLNSGNTSAAFAELRRGLAIEPNDAGLNGALMLAILGERDEAEIRKLLETSTDFNRTMLQSWNDPAAGLALIRERAGEVAGFRNPLAISVFANWAAFYGAPDVALELLRGHAGMIRAGVVPAVLWYPVMRDVRKLPAFKEYVREIGLVDYWRESGWSYFCRPLGDDDFECR